MKKQNSVLFACAKFTENFYEPKNFWPQKWQGQHTLDSV